jgi:uncharacterized membrane protein
MALTCFAIIVLALHPAELIAQQTAAQPPRSTAKGTDNNAAMPDFRQIMKDQMETMGTMWGRMAEDMINATVNTMSKPEVAEKMATFTKNYFDALIAKGFTREEALRIVMSVHIPMAPGK